MSIFLSVLAVIGKVLLIVLLIALVLLLCLLFAPFMYRADGAFDPKEGSVFVARLHDFSHFFGISAAYSDGLVARLTLLWGAVKIPLGEKAERPRKEKKKKSGKHAGEEQRAGKAFAEGENRPAEAAMTGSTGKSEPINVIVTQDGLKASKEKTEDQSERQKESGQKKKETTEAAGKKADRKKSEKKPKGLAAAVTGNLSGLNFIIGKVFALIRKMKPTVLTADLDYSTGEPDTTAYVTGVLALLPFVYGKKKSFRPDFSSDDPYVSGSFGLRGKIFLFQAVYIIIRIIADKEARDFIGDVLAAVKQQKKDEAAKEAA